MYFNNFKSKIYFNNEKGDYMEISITKISPNGQIVIPAEIRKDAKIKTSTKFLIFNQGGNIMLKQLNKEKMIEEMELIEKINRAEEQIKKGKSTKVDSRMSAEEIDRILMS